MTGVLSVPASGVLKEILGKLLPEPARQAPLPSPRHHEPPSRARGDIGDDSRRFLPSAIRELISQQMLT
jgi:hypothetical protein